MGLTAAANRSKSNFATVRPDTVFSQDATQPLIGRKVDYEAQKERYAAT
jgi:hypothetical protein